MRVKTATLPEPLSLESRLAHADWVRKLAYVLVRDEAKADDLTQETWLAALRSPPDPTRPLRPWLAEVVRNLSRMNARSTQRRNHREIASQREVTEKEQDTPERLLERAEAQRMLSELVLRLDEPYRATVLLRYFEGCSAEEIGKRQQVPAATVRWRLAKSLEKLRSDLDVRHAGDRRAWQLALVPLGSSLPLTDPSVPVVTKGVPVMKTFLTLALVASVSGGALLIHKGSTGATKAAPSAVVAAPSAPANPSAVPSSARRDLPQRTQMLAQIQTIQKKTETSPSHETAPALNREYIRDQMRALIPMIKDCYEDGIRIDPDLHGKLFVQFTIVGEPDVGGLVSESKIVEEGSTLKLTSVRECIRDVMYSAVFPAPPSGGEQVVTYPFELLSAPPASE
jgi:RNA polymerase sigma-70 factor (ECF subfamily)